MLKEDFMSREPGCEASESPEVRRLRLRAANRPPRQRQVEPVTNAQEDDEPEVDWEDEMANHKHEYVTLPDGIEQASERLAARYAAQGFDPDDYPPDWIERSNRLAAQDDD
jgi:hypothetical protein